MVSEDDKLWAFLGVFLGVLGFVLVLLMRKNNSYAMFYARQGLILTIAYAIASVISFVPLVGWVLSGLAMLLVFILWIIGIVYAVSGKKKDIPIIGEFAREIKV